jgi:flagellar biogenesis protein FliO
MPKAGSLSPLVTTASSLAIVLGLFFVFAWAMRRASPRGSTLLPADVLEVLGRAPLAARQQVYLIRCGQKLVLVHVCPDGVETLTEITQPEEVERLLGLCRQTQPNSATTAFRQVFQQFAGERTTPGFLGESAYDDVRLANAGISRPSHGRLEDDDV